MKLSAVSHQVSARPAVVIGGGAFGTALASVLASKHEHIVIWARSMDVVDGINRAHENAIYLPGIALPKNIRATQDLNAALADSQLVILATPSQAMSGIAAQVALAMAQSGHVICASKGIDKHTLQTMPDVLATAFAQREDIALSFLSGPSFAREVALGLPTSVVVAARYDAHAHYVQNVLSTPVFRCYSSHDVQGVELAGALKNVYAIATGMIDGLERGLNARAALITRSLNEMTRLGVALGAHPLTFAGLAGAGDLILTCTGDLSRNRKVGLALGRGQKLADILKDTRTVAEGVETARAARALSRKHGVTLPIADQVCRVLDDEITSSQAFDELMRSELEREWL